MNSNVIRLLLQSLHPSWFIQDELDSRGWTLDDLAIKMNGDFGVDRLALDFYFKVGPTEPNMRIGKEDAHRIANVFEVHEDFFINLENAWLELQPNTKSE